MKNPKQSHDVIALLPFGAGHEKEKYKGFSCELLRGFYAENKRLKQERQALSEKIEELYKKHKNCKHIGFLCLEQFIDELKEELKLKEAVGK